MPVGSLTPALEFVEGANPMQSHTNIARLTVKRLSEPVSVWQRIACAQFEFQRQNARRLEL